MTERPNLLFIYGTLMAVAQHPLGDLLREKGEFIGKGSIRARLYEITETDTQGINQYPGAVPSAFDEDRVYGEVWQVNEPDEIWPLFDAYEACTPDWKEPWEFEFRRTTVRLEDGREVITGVYLYAWDTSRAEPILSGRYDKSAPKVR